MEDYENSMETSTLILRVELPSESTMKRVKLHHIDMYRLGHQDIIKFKKS